MRAIEEILAAHDGVAAMSVLSEEGITRSAISRAVTSNRVRPVRKGWLALPGAAQDAVQAVTVGGALTCLSVLRRMRIWCDDDYFLHVRVGRNAGHLSAPHDRRVPLVRPSASGVRVHRSRGPAAWERHRSAVDPLPLALTHLFLCQERENVIVSLDSALNGGHISPPQLRDLTSQLPARYAGYLELLDGSSQSGLETKARLRLRRLGIPYRSQVFIAGVGRVDLLIGDRLVLELDGQAWHTGPIAYAEDRRRDLELLKLGYTVVRVSYAQVMNQWPDIEDVIRGLVARREHLWAARHRRAGLAVRTGGDSANRSV